MVKIPASLNMLAVYPIAPVAATQNALPRQRLGQVRDVGGRSEDTQVVRIPASSARGVSRARRGVPLLAVALAVVAVAFFVLPLVGLLQRAPWGSLWDDLTTPQAKEAIRLSVVCSLWSTALCVVFGVPLAWVLARTRSLVARSYVRSSCCRWCCLRLWAVSPCSTPSSATVVCSASGCTTGSGFQFTFSTAGAVLAETFVAMPFLVITVEAGLRTMDQRYEDAAASLGAGRWTVFRRVTIPLIAPALYAGPALAWARALGEFGATITFAGNIQGRTQTVPLAVYLFLESQQGVAIALSLVLLAVSVDRARVFA